MTGGGGETFASVLRVSGSYETKVCFTGMGGSLTNGCFPLSPAWSRPEETAWWCTVAVCDVNSTAPARQMLVEVRGVG